MHVALLNLGFRYVGKTEEGDVYENEDLQVIVKDGRCYVQGMEVSIDDVECLLLEA